MNRFVIAAIFVAVLGTTACAQWQAFANPNPSVAGSCGLVNQKYIPLLTKMQNDYGARIWTSLDIPKNPNQLAVMYYERGGYRNVNKMFRTIGTAVEYEVGQVVYGPKAIEEKGTGKHVGYIIVFVDNRYLEQTKSVLRVSMRNVGQATIKAVTALGGDTPLNIPGMTLSVPEKGKKGWLTYLFDFAALPRGNSLFIFRVEIVGLRIHPAHFDVRYDDVNCGVVAAGDASCYIDCILRPSTEEKPLGGLGDDGRSDKGKK